MEKTVPKSTPRDVFMYLLAMAALYWSAASFVRLVFEHINVAFPDSLNMYHDPGSGMRWAIASLVIIFPLYLWITNRLEGEMVAHPEKREIKIRKWLIYLTLFLSALFIVGDLVALIFNFLEGDLTVRFLLKMLTVLATAGTVFGYYFLDLRRDEGKMRGERKLFAWGATIAVVLAVVGGFLVAGSPFKQRLVKFDYQKTSDLQTIQWQIVNYWQAKEQLPATLADLEDDTISGFITPRDPQTGETYEYKVTGPVSFELCAEFNLSASESSINPRVPTLYYPEGGPIKGSWDHPEGVHCFDRTIDPDFYPEKP